MQIIQDNIDRLIGPPLFSLVLLAFVYLYARMIKRGGPLNPGQKKIVFYTWVFGLGMAYIIAWHEPIGILVHWQRAWVVALIFWGAVLGTIAWYKNRCRGASPGKTI